jgi:hypothetical protein
MSSHATKAAKDNGSLRIVLQHRDRASMIYELSCNGDELDITISPRKNTDDPGDWHIEARAGRAAGAGRVTEWAATRADALRAVGRKWASNAGERQLPAFDWEAVAVALAAVRAL